MSLTIAIDRDSGDRTVQELYRSIGPYKYTNGNGYNAKTGCKRGKVMPAKRRSQGRSSTVSWAGLHMKRWP